MKLLFLIYFCYLFFFFFFSSRRRHTRCSRDWSSDVCSSDLPATSAGPAPTSRARCASSGASAAGLRCSSYGRSEERRVGKEGRARGWPGHSKKKRKEEQQDEEVVE